MAQEQFEEAHLGPSIPQAYNGSRISWLKDGDANTRLFHMHARHRKRKNFIGKLIAGERVCTSHEDKAAIIDDFYDNLLEPVQ